MVSFVAILLVLLTFPASADPVPDDIGMRVADSFAAPALDELAGAASRMGELTSALCDRPGTDALKAARAGFADLVAAWGRASVLRFGPLQAENRFERAFFWPDPRGVIVRQVQGLLAGQDDAALTADGLGGKSVALQGLPALEFVLHGGGADEMAAGDGGYRCRYGAAVAANVAGIAGDAAAAWRDSAFHASLVAPHQGSDPYRSKQEVAGEIVKALGTGLQFTRNAELLPALGQTEEDARGKRAPLWRSNLTFALAAARLDGLSALLDAAGFGDAEDARAVVDSLKFDLRHARDALAAVTAPAELAFADAADRERIRYVTVVLEAANAAVSEQLSAALGLTMGFNALDGD